MRAAVFGTFFAVSVLVACGPDAADPLFDKSNKAGAPGAAGMASGGAASGVGGQIAGGVGGTAGTGGVVTAGNGGGGDTATGGTAGSGAGGENACVPEALPAAIVPANVIIVFDRSGSMEEALPGGQGITKWTVAKNGLAGGLDAAKGPLNLAFSLFPAGKFEDSKLGTCFLTPNEPSCKAIAEDAGCKDVDAIPAVGLGPLEVVRPQIAELVADTLPKGGTPTRWALEYGWEYLRNSPAAGERHLVLVTDGQPQVSGKTNGDTTEAKACGTLADLAARTTEVRITAPSVKTHVIGSPGDVDNAILSGLALNGGTAKDGCTAANYQTQACHYQLEAKTYAKGMENALIDIFSKVSDRCLLTLPEGTDPAALNVTAVTPAGDVSLVRDPSHTDGWDLASEDATRIRVHGPTCATLTGATLLRGCPTVGAP